MMENYAMWDFTVFAPFWVDYMKEDEMDGT
jgi:hypothetical protein